MTQATPVVRTLLLSDVVDSTALVEGLGDVRAAEVWRAHDRVARDLLPAHNGLEIDKTDGFLLLFEAASDAVRYAAAYHRALAVLSERLGMRLQARAGMHTGEVVLQENAPEDVARGAKPLEVEGIAKPTAARIMSLAQGGRTLLSSAAQAALPDGLGTLRLLSHGHWRLKGVAQPVELFEVGEGDGAFEPPPDAAKAYRVVPDGGGWRPLRATPHLLPPPPPPLFGRSAVLARVWEAFDTGTRLVSLVGPEDSGRSSLALHYAHAWRGDWPGGAWWLDANDLADEATLLARLTGLLDSAGLAPGPHPAARLRAAGPSLLVLDNLPADATAAALVEACPGAVLVTTRHGLGLPGERVLTVPPLPRCPSRPPKVTTSSPSLRWRERSIPPARCTRPTVSRWPLSPTSSPAHRGACGGRSPAPR